MSMLANRRQILQGILTASALPSTWAASTSPAIAATPTSLSHLTHFVFDNRFAEAVATAHSIAHAVPLAETNGDMTDLWFHDLHAQWKRTPQPLAGITTSQGLFVLETLATDHRMRVVHRAQRGARHDTRALRASIAPNLHRQWLLREPADRQLVAWVIAPRRIA